jgi:hypothetical protein
MLNDTTKKNNPLSNLIEKIRNNIEIGIIAVFFAGFLTGITVFSIIESMTDDNDNTQEIQSAQTNKNNTPAPAPQVQTQPVPAANTPPVLPAYLNATKVQQIFAYIVTAYNKQDGKALYAILGPLRKSQLTEDALVAKIPQIFQVYGGIQSGSLTEQKFLGQQGNNKVFQFIFTVEYEKTKKGTLSFVVLDDGANFQIDSIIIN